MSRLINADDVLDKMKSTFEMQELYLPIHLKELITDDMPTIPAIVIPEGATTGDMIKAILPNAEIRADLFLPSVNIYVDGVMVMRVDRDLWNAPYKKEGE